MPKSVSVALDGSAPAGGADMKMVDFQKHVDDSNIDFKENIMKKVEMIKLTDNHDLNRRVDMIKKEEHYDCSKLNKEYLVKEEAEQHMVEKTRAKKDLLMRIIAEWESTKTKRRIFLAWKQRQASKKQNQLQGEYCQAFYLQGAKMRAFKAFKLYAQVAGNRMYERRVKERINIKVQT